MEAAEQAVGNSKALKILFLAGRVFVEAGEIARAWPLIDGLASELRAEPQAHAKILEGEIALKNRAARQAIRLLTEAEKLLDTWVGHFALGRAFRSLRTRNGRTATSRLFYYYQGRPIAGTWDFEDSRKMIPSCLKSVVA